MEDHFITVRDVAEAIGVKEITVRRWIDKGLIRAYKIGKSYRIRNSDLEKFLEERKVEK